MPHALVLPDTIIKHIDDYADVHGTRTFPHNGRLHFWSGPRGAVWDLISGQKEGNGIRGTKYAKANGAMVVANSPIGKYLTNFMGVGTFTYYELHPSVPPSMKREYGIRPWRHTSHLFALSAYGRITTTVCGADRFNIYYSKELPNVVYPDYLGLSAMDFLTALSTPRKKEVETINLIPFDRILDAWDDDGIEAAHTMICIGEQRMALHEARGKSRPDYIRRALKLAANEVLTAPADAYKYFLESHEYFFIARALEKFGPEFGENFIKNREFEVRQKKRGERLNRFATNVISIIEAELAPLPPAARPAYAIPAYLRHVAPR